MYKRDIVINKVTTIERCIVRIKETYVNHNKNLTNLDNQDIIVLNIQKACQASIDLAMHICMEQKLGAPVSSADAFNRLFTANILSSDITDRMQKMVGFRNVAVHEYQSLNLNILRSIVEHHLTDFTDYTKKILHLINE